MTTLSADYAPVTRAALLALPGWYGDIDVLARARAVLPPLPGVLKALAELAALAASALGRADVAIDLADLRGLAPRERARVIIDHCVAEPYRQMLNDYVAAATLRGGHTPHVLEDALSWHTRYRATGTMLEQAPLALLKTGS